MGSITRCGHDWYKAAEYNGDPPTRCAVSYHCLLHNTDFNCVEPTLLDLPCKYFFYRKFSNRRENQQFIASIGSLCSVHFPAKDISVLTGPTVRNVHMHRLTKVSSHWHCSTLQPKSSLASARVLSVVINCS